MVAKFAAPAVEILQLLSVIETPVADDDPIVIVFATAAVPILIVLAFAPVPTFTVPVVPESIVMAFVVFDVIDPAPAKDSVVAVTPIVSIEATPVKAPPVVTFNPPEDVRAKVPVAFPIAVFPVEAVFKLSVGAVIAAVPEDSVCVSPVSPVEEIAPDVDVRDNAPVVIVKPLEAVSVLLADSVVKAPEPGVPLPIEPGEAKVAPPRVEAFTTPLPEKVKVPPVPTVIVAVVFVPVVIASNEGVPPVESAEHSQTSVVSFHFNN